MTKGGVRNIRQHRCEDFQIRQIEPVYFRSIDAQTGKRVFKRQAWFCGHCGYGDWRPLTRLPVSARRPPASA